MGDRGHARRRAGLIAAIATGLALLFGPGQAQASDCTLSGPGLEGPTTTTFHQIPGPTLKASMIFVDFSDHPAPGAETPPQSTIGPQLAGPAVDYYLAASYDHLTLDVKMDDAWVRMPHPSTSYTATTFQGQRDYMADAITAANNAGFDFSGRQTLYVVGAPTGGTLPNSPAFTADDGSAIVVDGTRIRWGSTLGDDAHLPGGYGAHVLEHETGHTLGLPDLYRYGAPTFDTTHLGVGSWDLMGWIGPGMDMMAWHKLKLGWLEPSEWTCVQGSATADLTPLDDAGHGKKMLVAQTSPTTAYVAEVRGPSGLDSGMCDNGGVLIYKVDNNALSGWTGDTPPIQVALADPSDPGDPNGPCAALANAPFGVGPGEVSDFAEGGVTVHVASGNPSSGYRVTMTGPTDGPPTTHLNGAVGRKLQLTGLRKATAKINCPTDIAGCGGTLTLRLKSGKTLAERSYSAAAGVTSELGLKIRKSSKRALRKALGHKQHLGATVTLDGPSGTDTTNVKLLR
jgi:M6 family metalloprotease-like protein